MNAGFEDIFVLNQIIKKHDDDWETIFQEYQQERKPNADAIAELSYRNFIEMSSKTADPKFLLQKKISSGASRSKRGQQKPGLPATVQGTFTPEVGQPGPQMPGQQTPAIWSPQLLEK